MKGPPRKLSTQKMKFGSNSPPLYVVMGDKSIFWMREEMSAIRPSAVERSDISFGGFFFLETAFVLEAPNPANAIVEEPLKICKEPSTSKIRLETWLTIARERMERRNGGQ